MVYGRPVPPGSQCIYGSHLGLSVYTGPTWVSVYIRVPPGSQCVYGVDHTMGSVPITSLYTHSLLVHEAETMLSLLLEEVHFSLMSIM